MIARIAVNHIEVRGRIPTDLTTVWSILSDFGSVQSWNPFVASAEIIGDGVGMTRAITATNGARVVERLEVLDHANRQIRYAVELESGARSLADIRLEEDSEGTTEVVWQSIRDSPLTEEQQDAIAATLLSRIDALSNAAVSIA
jgi:hypothetical protein